MAGKQEIDVTALMAKIDALEAKVAEQKVSAAQMAAYERMVGEEGAPLSDKEVSDRATAKVREDVLLGLKDQPMVDVILLKGWYPYEGHPDEGHPNRPNKLPRKDSNGEPTRVSVHRHMAAAMVDARIAEPANPFSDPA